MGDLGRSLDWASLPGRPRSIPLISGPDLSTDPDPNGVSNLRVWPPAAGVHSRIWKLPHGQKQGSAGTSGIRGPKWLCS